MQSTTQPDLFAVTEYFDIAGLQVDSPNGGEYWEFAEDNEVLWLYQGAGANIGIDLAFVDDPERLDLFEYTEPMVVKKLQGSSDD